MQATRLLDPKRVISIVPIDNPIRYSGQGMVTLSYDDGFKNNYTKALPLHQKYNIPLSLNIIAGNLQKQPRFMTRFEVRDSRRRGAEIASHSYSHENLTTKTDAELHFEFGESLKVLSDIVGDVETFAVPYSQYNEDIKSIGSQYYSAIRVHGDKQNDIPPSDPYWLNCAIAVRNSTTFLDVKNAIDTAVSNQKWCIIMLHGINEENDGEYEITPQLLEEILQYIASFDESQLLPVNTKDGIQLIGN